MSDQQGGPPRDGQPTGSGWGAPPPSTPPGWSSPPPSAPGYGGPPPGYGGPPPGYGGPPPGYGGPQPGPGGPVPPAAWHRLPPEELARMHQPGIVPLRPLGLGDVFGGALQTMRRNPGATIGTGFLVLTLLLVPSYLASLAVLRVPGLAAEDLSLLVTLVSLLFSMLASVALTGMIVHVVGEAVLGDRVGLGETWRAVRRRIPALLGTVLLVSVLLGLVVVVAVLGFVLLGFLAAEASEVAAVVVVVLGVLAVALLLVWAGIRMSLAPAAVVLEEIGPWRGLRRAWSLTRGGQGWRVVGITLLASLLTSIFTSAVQVPVLLGTLFLGGVDLMDDSSMVSPVVIGADHVAQLLVGSFVIPFTAGVTALLYLDQRIRREGLETTLLHAAQARAAARSR